MRGAAFLSGLKDAIVIDIGGTTTDIGVLQSGFPRVAAAGRRHRRRAHQLPYAGYTLDWAGRRLH